MARAAKGAKRKAEDSLENGGPVKNPQASDIDAGDSAPPPKRRAIKKEDDDDSAPTKGKGNAKRPTTKKEKPVKHGDEPMMKRTLDTPLRIGAHVSSAGGVQNAVVNAIHIGANAFALFLKPHKRWDNKDLEEKDADLFKEWINENNMSAADCCVPHGSYLVNLAHPDPVRKKQAYDSFHNDLTRCHRLGIKLYNFHPGNSNASTREEGIQMIAQNINEAHQDPATGDVVAVLETMASLGNTIGGTFKDLAEIIDLVEDKTRIGVCLDTCHVFAAGYDLRSPEAYSATMEEFDNVIGLEYLKAFHLNDSKAPLSSYRDLHARIGTGYLGLSAFHNLMNDERFHGIPMVLETPVNVTDANGQKTEDKGIWAREIKLLESLAGMDITSVEFKDLETKLQEEGESERERINDQVERKKIKTESPKKKKGKKKVESDDEANSDE